MKATKANIRKSRVKIKTTPHHGILDFMLEQISAGLHTLFFPTVQHELVH
jgi:hypothetical protein